MTTIAMPFFLLSQSLRCTEIGFVEIEVFECYRFIADLTCLQIDEICQCSQCPSRFDAKNLT